MGASREPTGQPYQLAGNRSRLCSLRALANVEVLFGTMQLNQGNSISTSHSGCLSSWLRNPSGLIPLGQGRRHTGMVCLAVGAGGRSGAQGHGLALNSPSVGPPFITLKVLRDRLGPQTGESARGSRAAKVKVLAWSSARRESAVVDGGGEECPSGVARSRKTCGCGARDRAD